MTRVGLITPLGLNGVTAADLVPSAFATNPAPSYVDPLLLDLTGNGIQVSNWIRSPVYFDTGVFETGDNPTTPQADGLQHEDRWAKPGTGIVVLDVNGNGKIDDITETVSEFLNAGPTPGHYADGLGALKGLAAAGATRVLSGDLGDRCEHWPELVVRAQGVE